MAPSIVLTSLAIFLSNETCDYIQLSHVFASACPKLRKFAISTSVIPSSAFIALLSRLLPCLSELTVCAYLTNGSWQWPDSASAYASSLSAFQDLRFLAINHNDDISTYEVDDGSSGKFTYDCSKEGATSRLAFCKEIAKKCVTLNQISFCPIEQANSAVKIGRNNASEFNALFVQNGEVPFWQTT